MDSLFQCYELLIKVRNPTIIHSKTEGISGKKRKKKKKTEEVTDEPCDHSFSVFLPLAGSDHIKNTHEDLSLNQHIIKAVSNSKNRKVLSGSLGSDNEIKKTRSANFHLIKNSKMVKRKWLVLFCFPFFSCRF